MHGRTFDFVPNQCRATGGRLRQQMARLEGQQHRIGRCGGIDRMQQQSKQMKFNQSACNQPAAPAAETDEVQPISLQSASHTSSQYSSPSCHSSRSPMHGRTFDFVPNQCRATGGRLRQQMARLEGQQHRIGRCGGIDRMQQQSKQMKFNQSACNQPAAPAAETDEVQPISLQSACRTSSQYSPPSCHSSRNLSHCHWRWLHCLCPAVD